MCGGAICLLYMGGGECGWGGDNNCVMMGGGGGNMFAVHGEGDMCCTWGGEGGQYV